MTLVSVSGDRLRKDIADERHLFFEERDKGAEERLQEVGPGEPLLAMLLSCQLVLSLVH